MNEPENRALVLFENQVDMEVWFRDDGSAPESFKDKRWLRCGDYDSAPVSWDSVLRTYPHFAPQLLVRAA